MKKILILLFLTTATTFVSCNKDDDNVPTPLPPTTAELIVGSWEFSQVGLLMGETEMLEPYDHQEPACGKDYIQFNSNNTGADFYHYYDTECGIDEETFTYTINGEVFSMVYSDGYTLNGTVMTVNSTTLKIKATVDEEGVTYTIIAVFNKK